MATSLTLQNDSSLDQGYIKVNGITAATITENGITGNLVGNVTGNVTGSLTQGGSLTLATAQTASGTAVDFTGIPSWAKRITVIFNGLSTTGTDIPSIQLGDSGGIENSGYIGSANGNTASSVNAINISTGIEIANNWTSSMIVYGSIRIINITSNIWVFDGVLGRSDATGGFWLGGSKTLSGTLDRLRVITTDTFDAGTINISYEG